MNVFNVIKERVSILDVISQHIVLKKIGQYWKGQCPFHSERTASFTVSPHRGIFYCFGCQSGGDVISFITKVENCSAIDAAKQLADRYNIELPEAAFQEKTAQLDEKKRYFALCELVAEWAHKQFLKTPFAKNYVQQRSISERSIEQFTIGYFPEGEKGIKELTKDAAAQNFLLQDLFHAGILNEGKTAYSPFEGRLLFPIKDHLGHYCGFGGRVIKPTDQRSKYYNSKENSFFQKGTLLFGLDSAKKEIQKTGYVFLVEGYTDCVAMAQHGYPNTVATLGTACTLDHLKSLAQHAHTVYVIYDTDTAGHNAILRLAQLCWQVNLEIKVIDLPDVKDPAAFFEKHTNLQPHIDQAQDILQFFLSSLGQEFATQPLNHKLQATRLFLEVIKKLEDPLKREILLQRAATTFDLPLASLKQELGAVRIPVQITATAEPIFTEISSLEKNFICAILNKIELIENTQVKDLLEYIPEPFRGILAKLKKGPAHETPQHVFASFIDTLDEHEKTMIHQMLLSQEEENYDIEQLLLLLEKKYWKKIVTVTKTRLAQAQEKNDTERARAIVGSFLELKKRLLHKGLI